jgi:hypothetical protein
MIEAVSGNVCSIERNLPELIYTSNLTKGLSRRANINVLLTLKINCRSPHTKWDEAGGTRSAHRKKTEIHIKFWSKTKRVKRIGRHGSRRRIILKYVLRKLVGRVTTELIWLWTGASGGLL